MDLNKISGQLKELAMLSIIEVRLSRWNSLHRNQIIQVEHLTMTRSKYYLYFRNLSPYKIVFHSNLLRLRDILRKHRRRHKPATVISNAPLKPRMFTIDDS